MRERFTEDDLASFVSEEYRSIREAYREIHKKYGDPLRIQTFLRNRFPHLPPRIIVAAVRQCVLQDRARPRIGLSDACLYTPEGIEQASSAATSALHARFVTGRATVVDVCSGIGRDAISFAGHAARVVCIESDPVTAGMLRHNLDVHGVRNAVVHTARAEDLLPALLSDRNVIIFADPSRRTAGRRTIDGESYSPSLSFLASMPPDIPMIVKAAPATRIAGTAWEPLHVAVGAECKELLLFRGVPGHPHGVIDADTGDRWPPSGRADDVSGGDQPCATESGGVPDAGMVIIEPHNAIIAARAVEAYLRTHGARPLDPRIAYGISSSVPPAARWHRSFRVLASLPFDRKRVQRAITALGFGPGTEIKKRGYDGTAEEIRSMFSFKGTADGVVIVTRVGGRHLALLCTRLKNDGTGP